MSPKKRLLSFSTFLTSDCWSVLYCRHCTCAQTTFRDYSDGEWRPGRQQHLQFPIRSVAKKTHHFVVCHFQHQLRRLMDVLQHIACLQRVTLVQIFSLLVKAIPIFYEHVSSDLKLKPPSRNIYHALQPIISAAGTQNDNDLPLVLLTQFPSPLLAVPGLYIGDGQNSVVSKCT